MGAQLSLALQSCCDAEDRKECSKTLFCDDDEDPSIHAHHMHIEHRSPRRNPKKHQFNRKAKKFRSPDPYAVGHDNVDSANLPKHRRTVYETKFKDTDDPYGYNDLFNQVQEDMRVNKKLLGEQERVDAGGMAIVADGMDSMNGDLTDSQRLEKLDMELEREIEADFMSHADSCLFRAGFRMNVAFLFMALMLWKYFDEHVVFTIFFVLFSVRGFVYYSKILDLRIRVFKVWEAIRKHHWEIPPRGAEGGTLQKHGQNYNATSGGLNYRKNILMTPVRGEPAAPADATVPPSGETGSTRSTPNGDPKVVPSAWGNWMTRFFYAAPLYLEESADDVGIQMVGSNGDAAITDGEAARAAYQAVKPNIDAAIKPIHQKDIPLDATISVTSSTGGDLAEGVHRGALSQHQIGKLTPKLDRDASIAGTPQGCDEVDDFTGRVQNQGGVNLHVGHRTKGYGGIEFDDTITQFSTPADSIPDTSPTAETGSSTTSQFIPPDSFVDPKKVEAIRVAMEGLENAIPLTPRAMERGVCFWLVLKNYMYGLRYFVNFLPESEEIDLANPLQFDWYDIKVPKMLTRPKITGPTKWSSGSSSASSSSSRSTATSGAGAQTPEPYSGPFSHTVEYPDELYDLNKPSKAYDRFGCKVDFFGNGTGMQIRLSVIEDKQLVFLIPIRAHPGGKLYKKNEYISGRVIPIVLYNEKDEIGMGNKFLSHVWIDVDWIFGLPNILSVRLTMHSYEEAVWASHKE